MKVNKTFIMILKSGNQSKFIKCNYKDSRKSGRDEIEFKNRETGSFVIYL